MYADGDGKPESADFELTGDDEKATEKDDQKSVQEQGENESADKDPEDSTSDEKKGKTNKEKQLQVYRDVNALYATLKNITKKSGDNVGETVSTLQAELAALKEYMDNVSKEHKKGGDSVDKTTQAALYYDKQYRVVLALKKDLETGKKDYSKQALELLETIETLCISEEASVVNGMRELFRPKLEEMLQREEDIRKDPNITPEEHAKSVSRSAELIRNLNGKNWSPAEGETLTAFCDRVRGYADEPNKNDEPKQPKRIRKVTNAQLKEQILRHADPNDPYLEADQMKQYDVKHQKKIVKAQAAVLREKLFPEAEESKEKPLQKGKKTSKKSNVGNENRQQEDVQSALENQGWSIV